METIMHKLTVLAAAIALFVPAIQAETLTPGAPTDFTVTFDYNGGSPIIKGSFKALQQATAGLTPSLSPKSAKSR